MIRRISKAETRALLKSLIYQERPDLKLTDYDSTPCYLLSDGTLLLDFNDASYSVIYGTEEEFIQYFEKGKSSAPIYILSVFPAKLEEFMEIVSNSKNELETLLNIQDLDFSLESLRKIDKAIKKNKLSLDFILSSFLNRS